MVQSFMLVKELQGGRSKEKKRKAKTGEKVLRKDVSLKSAPVRARLARNSGCHPHGRQRWCRQEAEGATSPLNERLTVAIELAATLHYSPVVWGLRCAATNAATKTDAAPFPVEERNFPALAAHFAPAHAA